MKNAKPSVVSPPTDLGPQDVQYFPNMSLGDTRGQHDFAEGWYTRHLKALGEPSMLELSRTRAHAYRFLWLPTFSNPVAVRVDVGDDGASVVTAKVTSGMGGYHPGVLTRKETRRLDAKQTAGFLDQVEKLGYWALSARDSVLGLDGEEWVLEGVKDGRYQLVVRWSPQKGPVREIGLAMLTKLAELKFPRREIY